MAIGLANEQPTFFATLGRSSASARANLCGCGLREISCGFVFAEGKWIDAVQEVTSWGRSRTAR